MKREEYEDITRKSDVVEGQVLKGIRAVLMEERHPAFSEIEAVLAQAPLGMPAPEIAFHPSVHYRVDLRPGTAKSILGVLRNAGSMYGPHAVFAERELHVLHDAWQGYCEGLSRRRSSAGRSKASVAHSVA
jgi:hypothetical protein